MPISTLRFISLLICAALVTVAGQTRADAQRPDVRASKAKSRQVKKKRKPKKRNPKAKLKRRAGCQANSMYFDGACRDIKWLHGNLLEAREEGSFLIGGNGPGARGFILLRQGNRLFHFDGKRVPSINSTKEATQKRRSKNRRRRSASTMIAQRPAVPSAFRKGQYLVQRRITLKMPEDGATLFRLHIEEPQRNASGRYRWRTVQMHTFNPRRQQPVCVPNRPCVNAEFSCEAEGEAMLWAAGSTALATGATAVGAVISGGVTLIAGASVLASWANLGRTIKDHSECVKNADKPGSGSK